MDYFLEFRIRIGDFYVLSDTCTHTEHRHLDVFYFQRSDSSSVAIRILKTDLHLSFNLGWTLVVFKKNVRKPISINRLKWAISELQKKIFR